MNFFSRFLTMQQNNSRAIQFLILACCGFPLTHCILNKDHHEDSDANDSKRESAAIQKAPDTFKLSLAFKTKELVFPAATVGSPVIKNINFKTPVNRP